MEVLILLLLLFYFTDFARLITFCLFKFIFRNEKNIFLSFYHSLSLHTGLEKTRTTTLLDSDWLYDILDLDLKNTQTTLRDLVWFFDTLDLKSARTTFTGVRLILWCSGLGLKKHLDCLTGLALILLYIGFGMWTDKMN